MNFYQHYLTIQQGVVLERRPAGGGIIIRAGSGSGVGLAVILQLLLLLVVVLPQMAGRWFAELSDS